MYPRVIAYFFFEPWCNSPSGPRPPHYRGFTSTLRHTTLSKTPLEKWSVWLLLDNTQHSQETNIHVPGRIWTHSTNKWAAAHSCLRTHGHRDRHFIFLLLI